MIIVRAQKNRIQDKKPGGDYLGFSFLFFEFNKGLSWTGMVHFFSGSIALGEAAQISGSEKI